MCDDKDQLPKRGGAGPVQHSLDGLWGLQRRNTGARGLASSLLAGGLLAPFSFFLFLLVLLLFLCVGGGRVFDGVLANDARICR